MNIEENGSDVSKHEELIEDILCNLNILWKLADNIDENAKTKLSKKTRGIFIHDAVRIKDLIGEIRNYICE